MSKVFSAHAVSAADGKNAALICGGLEAIPAPGVTHLHYEVLR